MYVDGWQANTTDEDVRSVLERFGAEQIKALGPDPSGWPAFTWRSFVDADEELVNLTLIGAWYNDRNDEQLEDLRTLLTAWLKANPPITE